MAPGLAGGISRGKAEGFTLVSSAEDALPLAIVAGNDDRGVIFGTGYLLRQLTMERQRLDLAPGIQKPTAANGHSRAATRISAKDECLRRMVRADVGPIHA